LLEPAGYGRCGFGGLGSGFGMGLKFSFSSFPRSHEIIANALDLR
jgi:hypothetical protein